MEDNVEFLNGDDRPLDNGAELNSNAPELNGGIAPKTAKRPGKSPKRPKEKPLLEGNLMRTQRLLMAALRVWELKHGIRD